MYPLEAQGQRRENGCQKFPAPLRWLPDSGFVHTAPFLFSFLLSFWDGLLGQFYVFSFMFAKTSQLLSFSTTGFLCVRIIPVLIVSCSDTSPDIPCLLTPSAKFLSVFPSTVGYNWLSASTLKIRFCLIPLWMGNWFVRTPSTLIKTLYVFSFQVLFPVNGRAQDLVL